MTAQPLFRHLTHALAHTHDPNEAKAIAYVILQTVYGLNRTAVVLDQPVDVNHTELDQLLSRIQAHEPIQYVLGTTEFYGRTFSVAPGVLIPRPETEELVQWVLEELKHTESPQLIDLGTGSGCIALTLAAERPDAQVTALDVSEVALRITRKNAEHLQIPIRIQRGNMLDPTQLPESLVEGIVSNPPYVMWSESREMLPHVLDHEPHLALFVEDDNPLLFYEAIAAYASTHLTPTGFCAVEINQALGTETADVFRKKGFATVEVKKDLSGRDRMILARLNS